MPTRDEQVAALAQQKIQIAIGQLVIDRARLQAELETPHAPTPPPPPPEKLSDAD